MFTAAKSSGETRERLIAAAGDIFARDGFQRAGVREICTLANANIASVKYYFGNKLGLYRETILAGVQSLGAQTPFPEGSLEAFLRRFLELTLIRRHNHPYIGSIMKHELREPTEVLGEVVQSVIRPLHQQFSRRLAATLGLSPSSPEVARLAAFSLSFCANLETSRAVLERLGLRIPNDERGINKLAKDVSAFIMFGATGQAPRKGRK